MVCIKMELTYRKFKQTLAAWRHHRFLKKHGCTTQRQYDLKYDTGYNPRAGRLKDIYHGYPHIFPILNFNHFVYEHYLLYPSPRHSEVLVWCYNNCKGKWRYSWHRVIKDYSGNWEENGISGADYIFFAFHDSRDATLFALKWI